MLIGGCLLNPVLGAAKLLLYIREPLFGTPAPFVGRRQLCSAARIWLRSP
jgi:hypothetical protein